MAEEGKVETSSKKHIKHENTANIAKPKNNLNTAKQTTSGEEEKTSEKVMWQS